MRKRTSSSRGSGVSEYKVELSGDAQDDVLSIRDYIRDVLLNQSAAFKFVSDTEKAALSFEKFPYSHMVRPGSKLFGGLEKRQFFYRDNYVMFYVIMEETKLVRVIKVAYAPSDLSDE